MKIILAAVCSVMLLIVGSFARIAAAAPEPYELNALIPLTGGGAFLGSAYKEAFAAIEDAVNQSGGIQGRPLRFVYSDTQTNPQVALQLVNGLIAKHVAAFIDGGPSAVCSASMPAVLSTGPVDYCLSAGVHPPAGSYVFSASVSTDDLMKALVRYFRLRGWRKLGLITSNDTTGQDFDRQIDGVLATPDNKGVQIVAHEHFTTTDLSVDAQMARIKAAGPDAVITWSTGTPFGTLLHGIGDVGLDVPISSTDANQTYAQMKAYAGVMPRQLFFPTTLSVIPSGDAAPPIHKAQDAYFAAFRKLGVRPDLAQNLAWDPAMLLVDALRQIGPAATAQQIRDDLLKQRAWVGVNGFYNFTTGDQRGIGIDATAIDEWDAGKGTWVQVSKPGGTPYASR